MRGDDNGILGHGGDVAGFFERNGRAPLDFSANTNPLGVPLSVIEAVKKSLSLADRYPDPLCRALRAALGEYLAVSPEHIFCANGAAEIIYRLARAIRPKTALLLAPSFSEYERALCSVGCEVVYHTLSAENGFELDESILPKLTDGIDLLLLCNPNNPTGRLIDAVLLDDIARRCCEKNIRLIVDECFLGFCDNAPSRTLCHEADSRITVINAFTKTHGMAGLRIGWCVCRDAALLKKMAENEAPWAVSSPAQAAAVAAAGDTEHLKSSRELIARCRPLLAEELRGLGCRVVGGEANFLLFSSDIPMLGARLEKAGVLIRDCSNFRGLKDGYYRVAVRDDAKNARLIAAIKAIRGSEQ